MDVLLPFTPELLHEPLMVLRDSLEFSGSFMVPVLVKLALQVGSAASRFCANLSGNIAAGSAAQNESSASIAGVSVTVMMITNTSCGKRRG